MGATAAQGTPVLSAAGALGENANFRRIHTFLHVLKGQFIHPEITGSQKYAAK